MYKKAYYAVLITMSLILAGCDKDDNEAESPLVGNTITAQVENGKAYSSVFSSVKITIYGGYSAGTEIASSDYVDGRFTFTLPETINSQYLRSMVELFGAGSGVQVSDKSAKGTYIDFPGYDTAGEYVEDFFYSGSLEPIYGNFMYVDRDVSLTGSDNISIYSVHLKKGWNVQYSIPKGQYKDEKTTKAPNGMKWYRYADALQFKQ